MHNSGRQVGNENYAKMPERLCYAITISRQLGSGGAFIGKQLATELGIKYADRDILERAAESLQTKADEIEARDEYAPSFLDSALEALSWGTPDVNCVVATPLPSYVALRDAEAAVIRELAARHSAVIVGRGGHHLLASHPRHLSIFLLRRTRISRPPRAALFELCARAGIAGN